MEPTTAEVRAVLLGMKERLVKGWIKGSLKQGENVCLYGAMIEATGIEKKYTRVSNPIKGRGSGVLVGQITMTYSLGDSPAATAAARLLARAAGTTTGGLALWNDAPERTHQDVVDLIDKALAHLDEETREEAPLVASASA